MIARLSSRFSRAVTALFFALSIPVFCAGQPTTPAPVNPRASSDDPRVGLKPGLHDAGDPSVAVAKRVDLREAQM